MILSDSYEIEPETTNEAWDCDPNVLILDEDYAAELDQEDAEGDWQVLALDRFGDRLVNGNLR